MNSLRNVLAVLTVCGGILTAVFISLNPVWWLLFMLLIPAGTFILMIFNRPVLGWAILIGLFFLAGFLFTEARQQFSEDLHRNRHYNNQLVTVVGVQIKRSETTLYGVQFLLRVRPGSSRGLVGKIMVSCRGSLLTNGYGRIMRITGKFKANPAGKLRFPQFTEQQGITGSFFAAEKPVLLKGIGLPIPFIWANQLRELMMEQGQKFLQPRNARLLHGMVFNDRLSSSLADRQQVDDLRRTGTIHLVSVAGLHVGFLVFGLTWLLSWLRVPKKWRILPLTVVVWFYILMTGMNPPVLRAGVMILVCVIGALLEVSSNNLNRLSLAALILLFWNPYNLFEASFQLSFVATLGVVWMYPLLKEYFLVKRSFTKPVWEALLVSLCAQIMVGPLIIYYFQQIAWVSPLANLLFFIPAEIIIIGGLLGEGIALMLPWLGRLILLLVDCNLSVIRWIAHFLASQSWSASWSPVWPWPWMVGFYLGLFLVLDSIRPNLFTKKRQLNSGLIIIILLALFNLVVWTSFLQLKQGRYLQLTAIDVGQGDSLFVETPDNFKLLIDGGNVGKGISRVIPFLRSIGVDQLDLVIATHGDSDHICGLAEVLEEIPAQKFFLPMETDGTNVKNILRRLQPYHIKYLPAFTGEQLKLGADVSGEILADPGAVDENDRSWVVVIKYGKNKLLLTGDLSEEGETVLARQYPAILRASVLKVGHHGSNYASGLNFISQIKPKVALISVGAGNHYGHPGPFTINRLRSLGIDIYRTDRWGSVTVKVYKDRFTVVTSK